MCKLIMGIFILALILTFSLISAEYIDSKIEELCEGLDRTAKLYSRGDVEKAKAWLDNSLQKWLGMENYMSCMLHGSKVELISETFYDYKYALDSSEANTAALKDKLVYLLRSISRQEKISLGSVL